jgi:hypothetical protein
MAAKGEKDTWTTASNGDEWATVDAEQQIALEREGEGIIARLVEIDPPNNNGIVQGHFDNVTDLNGTVLAGDYFMNLSRDLQQKLSKVPLKSTVRLEWTSSMPTGQKTPMRVFDVKWR